MRYHNYRCLEYNQTKEDFNMKRLKKHSIKQVMAAFLLGLVVMLGSVNPMQAADNAAPAKNITLTIGSA